MPGWTAPIVKAPEVQPAGVIAGTASGTPPAPGATAPGESGRPSARRRSGGGGRGSGGGGGGGYGTIVDAGAVLLALTPSSELVAFEPSETAFTKVARIEVAESPMHACPVLSGNRLFITDKDSVTPWTVE